MQTDYHGIKKENCMATQRLKSNKQRQALQNIKLSFLNNKTPTQIDQYIEKNINNLNDAKAFLKKLTKIVSYLLKGNNLQ